MVILESIHRASKILSPKIESDSMFLYFALEKDIETVVTSKGGWTNKHSFLQHTEKLDGIRSQSLATSIPDLYEAVQDYE